MIELNADYIAMGEERLARDRAKRKEGSDEEEEDDAETGS